MQYLAGSQSSTALKTVYVQRSVQNSFVIQQRHGSLFFFFRKTILYFQHCLNACLLVFILEEYARSDLFMLVGSPECLHRPTHRDQYMFRNTF